MYIERIYFGFLNLGVVILIIIFLWLISIPIWSDSKKVCEYWEEQNGKMVCIQEVTYFCLERECSLGSDK